MTVGMDRRRRASARCGAPTRRRTRTSRTATTARSPRGTRARWTGSIRATRPSDGRTRSSARISSPTTGAGRRSTRCSTTSSRARTARRSRTTCTRSPRNRAARTTTRAGARVLGSLTFGCDAPPEQLVEVVDSEGVTKRVAPCFDFLTEGDLLNRAKIPWSYYAAQEDQRGYIWSAYAAIRRYREDPGEVAAAHVPGRPGAEGHQGRTSCRPSRGSRRDSS